MDFVPKTKSSKYTNSGYVHNFKSFCSFPEFKMGREEDLLDKNQEAD